LVPQELSIPSPKKSLPRKSSATKSPVIWRGLLRECLPEIEIEAVAGAGPGGQNINKVWTAVQLRFDVRASSALDEATKARLEKIAGRRTNKEGVLIVRAGRFRTQIANRQDAIARFGALLQRALARPRIRRPTRPSAAADERRLEAKRRRSRVKKERRTGALE
jgi:ribosome-associated protein